MGHDIKEVYTTLEKIAKNHLNQIPKVFYNGETYNFVFLKDVATVFKKLANKPLDVCWFLKHCITKENPFTVYPIHKPSNGRNYSILVSKKLPQSKFKFIDQIIQSIKEDLHSNKPLRVKAIQSYTVSDESSTDCSDDFRIISNNLESKKKINEIENNKALPSFGPMLPVKTLNEIFNTENLDQSFTDKESSGNDSFSSISKGNAKNYGEKIAVKKWIDDDSDSLTILESSNFSNQKNSFTVPNPKKTRTYDFSDSEDQEVQSKHFKSPLIINQPVDLLSDIKSKLNSAFDDCPVISIDTFRTAYCSKNSVMFDYHTTPCPIPHHPHGTLSKFLSCFHEILELKSLRKIYILNKTPKILAMASARFNLFLKKENDPLHKLYVEALLTSIFAAKVTLLIEDFIDLFEIIYKNPISVLCKTCTIHQFINSLNSPNLILVKKNNIYNLTVTPLRCEFYTEWQSVENHKKVMDTELYILNGRKIRNEEKPKVLIFKDCCSANLLEIASCNVPNSVQLKVLNEVPELKFDYSWIYLNSNINFGSVKTFFK